jgi:hypothetical protein
MRRATVLGIVCLSIGCSEYRSPPYQAYYGNYLFLDQPSATTCLSTPLTSDGGLIDCVLYAALPTAGPESECTKMPGLYTPSDEDLQALQDAQAHQLGGDASSVFKFPQCLMQQMPAQSGESCTAQTAVGWCYVQNTSDAASAGNCGARIVLSAGVDAQIKGATYSFACRR